MTDQDKVNLAAISAQRRYQKAVRMRQMVAERLDEVEKELHNAANELYKLTQGLVNY